MVLSCWLDECTKISRNPVITMTRVVETLVLELFCLVGTTVLRLIYIAPKSGAEF